MDDVAGGNDNDDDNDENERQKTASGIFLPSSATSNPLPEATVIAVGPGAPNKEGHVVPTSVKTGDRVLLPGWGGNAIKLGEEVRGSAPGSSFFYFSRRLTISFLNFFLVVGILLVQGFGDFG